MLSKAAKALSFLLVTILCAGAVFLCPQRAKATSDSQSEATVQSSVSYKSIYDNNTDIMLNILAWESAQTGSSTLQEFIDGYASQNPINGNVQSFVQAICNSPDISADLYGYLIALSNSLAESDNLYPTSLQKSVITMYSAIDEQTAASLLSDDILTQALFNTIGQKGIMSYSTGLKMLYISGYDSANMTKDEIIDTLLSLQLEDGGFALSGSEGDVDVTAMTLQALAYALYDSEITEERLLLIESSIEKGLSFLSDAQLDEGDFASYGNPSSESTSQVIITLCALDINVLEDSRFIKSGSVLDGLLKYLTKDGGLSHSATGATNEMASAQGFEALVALNNQLLPMISAEESPKQDQSIDAGNIQADPTLIEEYSSHEDPLKYNPFKDYRFYLSIASLIISILASALSILLYKKEPIENKKSYGPLSFKEDKKKADKKANPRLTLLRKRLVSIWLIMLFALAIIWLVRIQSKDSYLNKESSILLDQSDDNGIKVTLVISAGTIGSPDILPATEYNVLQGTTVFELLQEVCRLEDIQLDYDSSSSYGIAYIRGISSIYEFDYGDLSGWMYRVDGEFPNVGAGYYDLNEGNYVEWLYTTNIGEDLK